MEEKKDFIFDLTVIIPILLKRWKLYAKWMAGAIVFSLVFIFTIPRYYSCQIMLAPEASEGGMNSLLSSFGFGETQSTNDAISPNLYPDLMQSKDFIVSLFPVEVTTLDGTINTTYFEYLLKHSKNSWYGSILGKLQKMLKSEETFSDTSGAKGKTYSPSFLLTDKQHDIVEAIAGKIKYNYDKKTGVITISVTDFDPLVCALIADTISSRLQDFILEYRTKKARIDLEYAQLIYMQTKEEYEEANKRYVDAIDANWDIINETAKARLETLNNEKSMKYQTFSTATQKLEAAKAKLQEATPVTTILQGASVPQKPAGPRRLLITLALMLFVGFICSIYLINTDRRWKERSH